MRKSTTSAAFLLAICLGHAVAQDEPGRDRGFFVDLSTDEQAARINASGGSCRITLLFVTADTIIVDAGPVMFAISCPGNSSFADQLPGTLGDIFGGPFSTSTTYAFHIVAEPGHTYEVDLGCFRMASQDATAEGDIAVCEPGVSGRVEARPRLRRETARAHDCEFNDRKERPPTIWTCVANRQLNTATIGLGRTQNQDYCWPSAGSTRERVVILVVDAGPIVMDATCSRILENDERKMETSSFGFDAEPGHIYTFSGEDEECMRLIDITSEETVIACEPYHEDPII